MRPRSGAVTTSCSRLFCAVRRILRLVLCLPCSLEAGEGGATRCLARSQARPCQVPALLALLALPVVDATSMLARQIILPTFPALPWRGLWLLRLRLRRFPGLRTVHPRSRWLCRRHGGLLGHTERMRVPVWVQGHEKTGHCVDQVLPALGERGRTIGAPVRHNVALRHAGGRGIRPLRAPLRPQDPGRGAEHADLEPRARGVAAAHETWVRRGRKEG